MSNFGMKIDLLKLKGAFLRNLQGKTSTKRCIIIPLMTATACTSGKRAAI